MRNCVLESFFNLSKTLFRFKLFKQNETKRTNWYLSRRVCNVCKAFTFLIWEIEWIDYYFDFSIHYSQVGVCISLYVDIIVFSLSVYCPLEHLLAQVEKEDTNKKKLSV